MTVQLDTAPVRIAPQHSLPANTRPRQVWLRRLALAAVAVLPLAFAGLFVASLGGADARLDEIPAAIVNQDEMITTTADDGTTQYVLAGRQLVTELTGSDSPGMKWTITNAEDADALLASGKVYAILTIPSDFSSSITSLATDAPRKAQFSIRTDDAHSYLAGSVAQALGGALASSFGSAITEQYLSGVYASLGQLGAAFSQAAEGSSELADGAGKNADGMDELAAGAADAAAGTHEYADGAADYADGVHGYADGVDSYVGGVKALSGGLSQLDAGVTAIEDQVAGLGDLSGEANQLAAIAQALAADPSDAAALQQLQDLADDLASTVDDLPSADELVAGLQGLRAGIAQSADGAQQLATQGTKLAAGAAQLASGADRLASGASALAGGSDRLASGVADAASGAHRLADGVQRFADGLAAGASQIPDSDPDQAGDAADVASDPVNVTVTTNNAVSQTAQMIATFLVPLGLWIGALAVFFVQRPVSRRVLASTAHSGRLVLSSLARATAVTAGQAALLVLLLHTAVGIPWAWVGATLPFALLLAAAFTAFHYLLTIGLGRAGLVISLFLLALQVASAGGIYPVELLTAPFQWISPFLPLTWAVSGMQQIISGGSVAEAVGSAVALLAFGAASVGIAFLAIRRTRRAVALGMLAPA